MGSATRNLLIGVISVLVPTLIAFIIFLPEKSSDKSWFSVLPALNAIINSLTSITLLLGYFFIKRGKIWQHKLMMISSFIFGIIFLISYITYHLNVPSTSFGGAGLIKYVYNTLLISHILLAMVVVPFVLFALYYALSNNFERHKKVVKFAWPVWLFVSMSGVLVYLMISPYY